MSGEARMRIVLAKAGLDGHDRGVRLVGRALRDAGMEVIYLKFATLQTVANVVLQEDADAVGISVLTGSHRVLLPKLVEILHELGCSDVVVTVGGIIPTEDFQLLKDSGVDAVYGPGTPTDEIVSTISDLIEARRSETV